VTHDSWGALDSVVHPHDGPARPRPTRRGASPLASAPARGKPRARSLAWGDQRAPTTSASATQPSTRRSSPRSATSPDPQPADAPPVAAPSPGESDPCGSRGPPGGPLRATPPSDADSPPLAAPSPGESDPPRTPARSNRPSWPGPRAAPGDKAGCSVGGTLGEPSHGRFDPPGLPAPTDSPPVAAPSPGESAPLPGPLRSAMSARHAPVPDR